MKKALVSIISLLLVFMLLIPVAISENNGDIYIIFIDGDWYTVDDTVDDKADNTGKEAKKKWIGDIAPNYKDYLLQRDFPASVIQDVSDLCYQHHGTPVGWLGLVSDKGLNLRSTPRIGNGNKIVTLQAGVTVYVYFKFTEGAKEWYYVTMSNGTCGYVRSNFLKLFPYTGE